MVSIALMVLGLIFGVVGLAISALPLVLVGALWIVCGLISRAYAIRVNRARQQPPVAGSTRRAGDTADTTDVRGAGTGAPAADPHPLGTMLVLTAINLVSGLTALAVGHFQLGFDAVNDGWHWLPLIAGIPPTVLAVIGIGMYGIGSASKAALGEVPTVPAVIVIRSVHDTGVYVNNKPRLEFELEVRPEGQPPYHVTKKATVPFAALGHVEIGHGFRATVAGPSDPTNMDVDWMSGFPVDVADADPAARLRRLDELHRQGLITEAEYESTRSRIIDSV